VRIVDLRDLFGRANADNFAAVISCFRSKIDNPIGGLNYFQIVLDHNERVAGRDQPLKNLEQHRDIVEVQTGGRLVENEQIPARAVAIGFAIDISSFGQMPDELQPLRFAAT
jgi:hypothetical protein